MSEVNLITSPPLNSGSILLDKDISLLEDNSKQKEISFCKNKPHNENADVLAVFYSSHVSAVGIDVHNNKMVLAYQCAVPELNGLMTDMLTTAADMTSLERAVNWILAKNPEVVIMESTGIYWMTLYNLLEKNGFAPKTYVLNAYNVKVMSGHKSDKTDAQHLAAIGRLGTFKGSFIPKMVFRDTRVISRHISNVKRDMAKEKCRLHKLLSIKGLKASTVFSNIAGPTARKILDAVMSGMQGQELYQFIEDNRGRLKASTSEIMTALQYTDIEAITPLYDDYISQIEIYEERLAFLSKLLDQHLINYTPLIKKLTSVPGVNDRIAKIIVSELGDDWSRFKSSKELCSWVGIAPGNKESAGHRINVGITNGNKYIRKALIEAAQSIGKMGDCHLKSWFLNLRNRMSYNKAITALAHKLLRIIYALVTKDTTYQEFVPIEPVDELLYEDTLNLLTDNQKAQSKKPKPAEVQIAKTVEDKETKPTKAKIAKTVKDKETKPAKAKIAKTVEDKKTKPTKAKAKTVEDKKTKPIKAKKAKTVEALDNNKAQANLIARTLAIDKTSVT